MIGRRASAAFVALAAVVAFGAGGPRPEVEVGARQAVAAAADEALRAARELREQLVPAMDAARAGAGRVVAGTAEPPGEPLLASGDAIDAALPAATRLAAARDRLLRLRLAMRPDAGDLPAAPRREELASLAGQLRLTASAGEEFAGLRRRAEGLTTILFAALRDAEAGDLPAARDRVSTARTDAEALEAWEIGAATMPVWLETANAMIAAVERTLDAIERGDAAAAEAAARAVAALGEDASAADRALRIAIGESGSALTATALGRLADTVRTLDVLIVEIASVRDREGG